MKLFAIKLGKKKVKTVWKEGSHRVSLGVCVPNDWNMNKMDAQIYEKTKLVVSETLEEAGRIPPITCRPHPEHPKKLQIIDGWHRWKMLDELGYAEIDVDVIYVSDKRAMGLTAELNYNRGEPDMEKYPAYLARMMKTFEDVDVKYLAERLPESEDEIRSYLEAADFEVDDVKLPSDDDEDDDDSKGTRDVSEADALLEMKFVVRQGAAEVIERELARLSKALGGGKNVRGRALEMMGVLSSQTPAGSIDSALTDDSESDSSVSTRKLDKKKRKKLKNGAPGVSKHA